jgi:hypothetical protein
MSEEVKQPQPIQEQAKQASAQEQPKPQGETQKTPYKVFETEEDFKKELQSVSSKAKYELLEKTGEKSVEGIKAKFAELDEVKGKVAGLSEIQAKLQTIQAEKDKLNEDLLMTKMGVKDELKQDFLTLAKSKVGKDVDLNSAMTQTIQKYSYFKGESAPNVKIGTEKKSSSVDLGDDEKQRLQRKFPHLRF